MKVISSKHIPILDGMRAYAVIMVCIVHFFSVNEAGLYEESKWLGVFFFKISQLGLRGVELFFILSGFLITGILIDTKESKSYFSTFYARRFLRIFPLYYFVLFISFVVLANLFSFDEGGDTIIRNQGWLWTYTSNLSWLWGAGGWDISNNFPAFGHFWSLCVEEHFYIIWPLLIYSTSTKRLHKVMLLITIFSMVLVLYTYIFGYTVPILKWSTLRYAGVLSLGGLIAYYFRVPEKFHKITVIAKRIVLPAGILLFLVAFIPRKFELYEVATFFASVVFFVLLLTVALSEGKLTSKLFKHKWLFFIGKISYGIYVYHGLLRPYFSRYLWNGFLVGITNTILSSFIYTLLCTALSILIAWLSWSIIESPILKLKKYFTY